MDGKFICSSSVIMQNGRYRVKCCKTPTLVLIFWNLPYFSCILSRAGSGTSGSRVPDKRLGYPNPILSSGTRKIALWEDLVSKQKYI